MGYIEQSLGSNEVVHYRARMPFVHRAFGWLLLLLGLAAAGGLYTEGQPLIAAAAGAVGGILFLMVMIPVWTTEIAVTNHRLIFKRGLFSRHTADLQLRAIGYRGPALRLAVGSDSTEEDLQADWKAVHEMIHLALPDVTQDHVWLAEGLAVYIESIARVQAGHLRPEKIWHEFVRDIPNGMPQPSDRGLEGTQSWGRTYWGGAIFCLLADVEMRKRSSNKVGLQDAMRGVLAAGGAHDKDWPIERILSVADTAVGMTVLTELYEKMGNRPYEPNLRQLWTDLGVIDTPEGASFDDHANLADVRRAIAAAPAT